MNMQANMKYAVYSIENGQFVVVSDNMEFQQAKDYAFSHGLLLAPSSELESRKTQFSLSN